MASGILIVDKAEDWTSHDVVAKLRGLYRERRIGHAGTLDPLATGVLPTFLGRATRAVEFAAAGDKVYIAGIRLGLVTKTQDITGEVVSDKTVCLSPADIAAVLPAFTGQIAQIPPMYSAIKHRGQKLYELARAGVEVARAPRNITIHSLTLLPSRSAEGDCMLRVHCSKGTYIRTLCHDIGAALGTGAAMSSLRRVEAAGFSIEEAVPISTLLQEPDPLRYLRPVDSLFAQHPTLTVDEEACRKVKNGLSFRFPAADGLYRVYAEGGEFLMLGQVESERLTTMKSFFEV